MTDDTPRPLVLWWDTSDPDLVGWALDHYEVTPEGGDAFCEADDLGPDADLPDLLRALRKAVGSRGYAPRRGKWTRDARGRWVAPPKGA